VHVPPAWFDAPEAAALAHWPESSHVRVVSVTVRGNRAEVVLDTDPHYPYWVYCERRDGLWCEGSSGNGPWVGWDDPGSDNDAVSSTPGYDSSIRIDRTGAD
jgi:hypothetical protein